jgi:ComF family protein
MLNIITYLLDTVFPPRDGELVVRKITKESLQALHLSGTYEGMTYASRYQHPTVHALITENKYYGNMQASTLLAQLIKIHLQSVGHCVLIPVPLHPKRERERGYNQVTIVLQKTGLPIACDLLSRTKHTPSQTTLHKEARLKNMSDAFTVNMDKLKRFENTHFILVDDVVTTGATMVASRAALAPHLHPTSTITCLALAH